jgi:toluene monooxygenase system ferredoxin subunit
VSFEKVTTLGELWQGEMRGLVVHGARVVVVHVDGEVHAYEDRCAHQEVPISEGRLEGCVMVCRAHEWRFDAKTGHGVNPEGAFLGPIPVRVEGDDVLLDVSVRWIARARAAGNPGGSA